ncbi:hypothetical protein RSAG8_10927, partial [Rhizoctonia solani AG-8 WAC10335]
MPHPQAVCSEKLAGNFSMPKQPSTHFVSARTQYRYRKKMGPAGGDDTSDTIDTATTDDEKKGIIWIYMLRGMIYLNKFSYQKNINGNDPHASIEMVLTIGISAELIILDIKNVEHVVARVFTRGVIPNGEWVIIDRSQGAVRTDFGVDEHGSEEED